MPLAKVLIMPRSASWHDSLYMSQSKPPRPISHLANCLIALRAAPEWADVVVWNGFKHRIDIAATTPWGKPSDRPWDDNDDRKTAEWLQSNEINVNVRTAGEAIETIAHENVVNPLLDWLSALKWDGTKRIHDWLTELLGVAPSDYSSLVGRKWLIAAVARAFQPGCKADCCLILEGPQGLKKSSALKLLAGGSEFFTDYVGRDLGSKEAAILCSSVWIIEFSEMNGIAVNSSGIEIVKAFLSRTDDRYRPHYGRHPISVPRQCVFAATTNADHYLADVKNRRFWPVHCGNIQLDRITVEREQLWAEATYMYLMNQERWWLEGDEEFLAECQQQRRLEIDTWQEQILDWLGTRTDTSTGEILEHCLRIELKNRTRIEDLRVVRILEILGWGKYRGPSGHRRWRSPEV